MPNIIKHKRASATSWAASNPVLGAGEIGVELSLSGTPQAVKIGDGVTAWNSLIYLVKGSDSTPVSMSSLGLAGQAGTSGEFARADHRHESVSVLAVETAARNMLGATLVDVYDLRKYIWASVERDASGLIEKLAINNRTITITRDAEGRMQEFTDGAMLWVITRDAEGNISGIETH